MSGFFLSIFYNFIIKPTTAKKIIICYFIRGLCTMTSVFLRKLDVCVWLVCASAVIADLLLYIFFFTSFVRLCTFHLMRLWIRGIFQLNELHECVDIYICARNTVLMKMYCYIYMSIMLFFPSLSPSYPSLSLSLLLSLSLSTY